MVYESDFYTVRRPYSSSRPTITSYSVTEFDDEAKHIRAAADRLMRYVYTNVPHETSRLPIRTITAYDRYAPEGKYKSRYSSDIPTNIQCMSYYTEPSRVTIGRGHLACMSYAGGRGYPRRKHLYCDENRDIGDEIKFRSYYLKNSHPSSSRVDDALLLPTALSPLWASSGNEAQSGESARRDIEAEYEITSHLLSLPQPHAESNGYATNHNDLSKLIKPVTSGLSIAKAERAEKKSNKGPSKKKTTAQAIEDSFLVESTPATAAVSPTKKMRQESPPPTSSPALEDELLSEEIEPAPEAAEVPIIEVSTKRPSVASDPQLDEVETTLEPLTTAVAEEVATATPPQAAVEDTWIEEPEKANEVEVTETITPEANESSHETASPAEISAPEEEAKPDEAVQLEDEQLLASEVNSADELKTSPTTPIVEDEQFTKVTEPIETIEQIENDTDSTEAPKRTSELPSSTENDELPSSSMEPSPEEIVDAGKDDFDNEGLSSSKATDETNEVEIDAEPTAAIDEALQATETSAAVQEPSEKLPEEISPSENSPRTPSEAAPEETVLDGIEPEETAPEETVASEENKDTTEVEVLTPSATEENILSTTDASEPIIEEPMSPAPAEE